MAGAVSVREAAVEDVGPLTSLVVELGYDATTPQIVERLARHRASDRDTVLVADDGDRVVGFVAVNVVPMLIGAGDVSRVGALCVTEDARGRGVGRALIDAAERWAVAGGSDLMQVNCGRREERAAAHRFYAALGYRDQHSHHVLYERLLTDAEQR